MDKYHEQYSTQGPTPQTERTPGREDEVQGRAGGYIFQVDDWTSLDRFLILGSEAPTYYASAKELTVENCTVALRLVKSNGLEVVQKLLEISVSGRASSNDPTLFILAMASAEGNLETREFAFAALPKIARIGTHLFHFLEYRKAFGGWGRMMKRGVQDWYLNKSIDSLAYQAIKYRQRDGWTHRDVLRKAHPKTEEESRNRLFRWIVKGDKDNESLVSVPGIVTGYEEVQKVSSPKRAAERILEYNLPREAVPTEFLSSPEVWEALLHTGEHGMPITALIRNLGNMSKIGLLTPFSETEGTVISKITDRDVLKKGRVHPYTLMLALKTYMMGHGFRGTGEWKPVSTVADALEAAMEMSFGLIEPSRKRILIGLDVSGSMTSFIHNSNISCREAAALMSLVTARSEERYQIMAFSNEFMPLDLTRADSFRSALQKTSHLPFMGTDCALPMMYALQESLKVDAFLIYTDNETWAGRIKPWQALQAYRKHSGVDAKLVVVAMTSDKFTIADPNDGGMLDVVGFDTAAPSIIADFIG